MKIRLFIFLLMTYLFAGCYYHDIGISNDIKGQWIWKSTCGGVVGCIYASQTHYKYLTITDSIIEISENGKVTFKNSYTVKNISNGDNSKLYNIALSDGTIWTVTISNNTLTIGYATVFYSVYEKQK